MHRREFVLGAAGIVGASTIGSVAYTSATVSRDANVNVESDSSAIIGLSPSSSVTRTTNSGEFIIDTTDLSASGINGSGATFEFGDTGTPSNDPAFEITNNGGSSKTFNVNLKNFGTAGEFTLYWDSGSVASNNNADLPSLSPGSSVQLAIEFDTTGLGSSEKIDGTIELTDV